jgi:hypothetical protein
VETRVLGRDLTVERNCNVGSREIHPVGIVVQYLKPGEVGASLSKRLKREFGAASLRQRSIRSGDGGPQVCHRLSDVNHCRKVSLSTGFLLHLRLPELDNEGP